MNHMATPARYSLRESSILQRTYLNTDTGRLEFLSAGDFYRCIELSGNSNLSAFPARR
jgi:hypothetical protein